MKRYRTEKAMMTVLMAALWVTACGKEENPAGTVEESVFGELKEAAAETGSRTDTGETLRYEYYDEDGKQQLEFSWNEALQSGTGTFYSDFESKFTVSECTSEEWQDRKWEVTKYGRDASEMEEYQENYEYNDREQLVCFCAEGILPDEYEGEEQLWTTGIRIDFFYREDGSLERKECAYSPRLFETTRQSEICYYDAQERLIYTRAYITHGYLEDYYIYPEDGSAPSYCLTLDHYGEDVWAALVSYD